jgi:hypothetical protein
MIVWGGFREDGEVNGSIHRTLLGDGGIYDPDANTWTAVSTVGAPTAQFGRDLYSAVHSVPGNARVRHPGTRSGRGSRSPASLSSGARCREMGDGVERRVIRSPTATANERFHRPRRQVSRPPLMFQRARRAARRSAPASTRLDGFHTNGSD